MLKTALESKYIRLALAVSVAAIVIIVALVQTVGKDRANMVDDGTFRNSLFAPKNVEILHQSSNYTMTGDGDIYRIVDTNGKLLYESDEEPELMDREGYIKTYEDGDAFLVNIYTGETVWKSKGEERIIDYWDGYWVVEDGVKEKDSSIFSTVIYYLLDDNFEVAANGVMFNYIDGNDEYIAGQKYVDYTYSNRNNLKGKDSFTIDTENVVLKDGEVYYVSEASIDHLDGDAAHLSDKTEKGNTHISLLPETLGEEMRGECYENDR